MLNLSKLCKFYEEEKFDFKFNFLLNVSNPSD